MVTVKSKLELPT